MPLTPSQQPIAILYCRSRHSVHCPCSKPISARGWCNLSLGTVLQSSCHCPFPSPVVCCVSGQRCSGPQEQSSLSQFADNATFHTVETNQPRTSSNTKLQVSLCGLAPHKTQVFVQVENPGFCTGKKKKGKGKRRETRNKEQKQKVKQKRRRKILARF